MGSETSYRTFIAYSSENDEYAKNIHDSLEHIAEVTPYKAEKYPDYGRDFKKRLQNQLFESHFVVVLLTSYGISSQWVNQEIGFAYGLKIARARALSKAVDTQPPYIIPIGESQVELKGFITKDSIDILFADRFASFEDVMACIIFTMRKYVPKGMDEGALTARITCSSCTDEFGLPTVYQGRIPSAERISRLIGLQREPFLEYACSKCGTGNIVDVRTFLPAKSTE